MVTGASTADLAVILIDARKGVLTQTRRHSYLAHLLGIRHIVLAVNKMDLVGYDQAVFDAIVADYRDFAASIGIEHFTAIPISGLAGDNIAARSTAMSWYAGPTLIEHLETVDLDSDAAQAAAVPAAGAMGQPPRSRFPRICRNDCRGKRPARRRGPHPALGPHHDDRPYRDDGWRSRPWPSQGNR